ncbi:helix-turn-helix domain-containing protein [Streptomyces sp. NBC_01433]|uniref:helix-turn-helix domain-containing protein n=1 Tax=Streptomyces sp. NBC_01433 TaxID=2903864 RepID=UPI0022515317|nr:helix-turn-helix transcriptional regulator [Streptomyces sp. NBC_01433]MCX4679274.1 helix-turn-helix domain-containing protein [Streptomyces sp. NBC_01433]
MVRHPLAPEQIDAGRRLGAFLRGARGGRRLIEVALAAGISPETLRKIETGRLPTPAFGTIVMLGEVLNVSLPQLADAWRAGLVQREAIPAPVAGAVGVTAAHPVAPTGARLSLTHP